MSSIQKLLSMLCDQKGAMLEKKSAEVLSAFLAGYAFARKQDGYKHDEAFLDSFNSWVTRRFKNKGGQGWAKLIAFYSANESEEWKLFWKLYSKYTHHQQGAKACRK